MAAKVPQLVDRIVAPVEFVLVLALRVESVLGLALLHQSREEVVDEPEEEEH